MPETVFGWRDHRWTVVQNVDGTYYVNEQVVDETEYLSQQSETLATSLNKGVKDFDTATLEDSESYILAYK